MFHAQKPFIVGLAGGSGSGKTTLSKIIATFIPWQTTIVPLDQFYADLTHLTLEQRKTVNFDDPKSIDMELAQMVLANLREGHAAEMPIYDFAVYNRSRKTQTLSPAPIILFEGMHTLYHLPLLELYDVTIFLNIDEETRWKRKLERDIAERGRTYQDVLQMWQRYTKPMHDVYVQPSFTRADLVFTDTFAPRVIEVITNEIRHRVHMKHNVTGEMPE
ncbi:MAG: uridine kinase [Candidatus Kerfeldbacteria bacterium]|nr:uridine kinase [Candidatus Kerfeldbacteria bacterium]